jgi:hypothetical protein
MKKIAMENTTVLDTDIDCVKVLVDDDSYRLMRLNNIDKLFQAPVGQQMMYNTYKLITHPTSVDEFDIIPPTKLHTTHDSVRVRNTPFNNFLVRTAQNDNEIHIETLGWFLFLCPFPEIAFNNLSPSIIEDEDGSTIACYDYRKSNLKHPNLYPTINYINIMDSTSQK